MAFWLVMDLSVSSQIYAGSSSFLAHDGGQEVSAHAQYSIDPISSPFDVWVFLLRQVKNKTNGQDTFSSIEYFVFYLITLTNVHSRI